jgi:glutaredoxin
MRFSGICLLLCCFAFIVQTLQPPEVSAKLYTWKDRNGVVRRTYYPPPADQVWREKKTSQSTPLQKPVRKNKVELFVTSWCPYCKKAIQYFQSRGIAFTAYDIEKDKRAAARKKKLDGRAGVPFAVVNGTLIHGFAPEQYTQALRK